MMSTVWALAAIAAAGASVGQDPGGEGQTPPEAAPVAVPAAAPAEPPLVLTQPYQGPFAPSVVNRLALTPVLDGRIDHHEWDPLALAGGLAPTAFQWHPGALFAAGVGFPGQDAVWSFDLAGDGWLVGADNLQIRVSLVNGQPQVRARRMDATRREGPVWEDAPLVESAAIAAGGPVDAPTDDVSEAFGWSFEPPAPGGAAAGPVLAPGAGAAGLWAYELRLPPIGFAAVREGAGLGVRVDLVPTDSEDAPAFLPRPTTLVSLRTERNEGLPPGFDWEPTYPVRQVVPGRRLEVRMAFQNPGDAPPQRMALWGDGLARSAVTLMELPFPAFDRRGRATVSYVSDVAPGAPLGWRILRGSATTADGSTYHLFSSFEVAGLVSIDASLPADLTTVAESRLVKGHVVLKSNSPNRLRGVVSIGVPPSWSVTRGDGADFAVNPAYGTVRIPIELIAPQRAEGLIPITIRVKIGDSDSEQTVYLPIQG